MSAVVLLISTLDACSLLIYSFIYISMLLGEDCGSVLPYFTLLFLAVLQKHLIQAYVKMKAQF